MLVEAVTRDHFARLAALFEACGSACFCRWWHFAGTKNEWIERCALRPEENRRELEEALAAGSDSARGIVAIAGDEVVGWMKLAPRASLPKLRALPVYRAHELGTDEGVFSIGCFLVHPEHRRRGVARAMLAAAPTIVRAWSGTAIEAYPHAIDRTMYDEEAWMGPNALFEHAGFTQRGGELPYPVLRLRVADAPV